LTAVLRNTSRQAGIDKLQQEQMVLKYIDVHGAIKRGDVMDCAGSARIRPTSFFCALSGKIQPLTSSLPHREGLS